MNDDARSFWKLYGAINELEMRLFEKDRKNADITYHEMLYLNAIYCGCDTVTGLANRFGVSKAAATKMVGSLCDKGTVIKTKDENDGRIQRLRINVYETGFYELEGDMLSGMIDYLQDRYGAEKTALFLEMLDAASDHLESSLATQRGQAPTV